MEGFVFAFLPLRCPRFAATFGCVFLSSRRPNPAGCLGFLGSDGAGSFLGPKPNRAERARMMSAVPAVFVCRRSAGVMTDEMNWCAVGWSGGCGRLVAGSGGLVGFLMGLMGIADGQTGRIAEEGQRGCCFGSCSSQPALRLRAAGVEARAAGGVVDRGRPPASGFLISGSVFFFFFLRPAAPAGRRSTTCWVQRHSMHGKHGSAANVTGCRMCGILSWTFHCLPNLVAREYHPWLSIFWSIKLARSKHSLGCGLHSRY